MIQQRGDGQELRTLRRESLCGLRIPVPKDVELLGQVGGHLVSVTVPKVTRVFDPQPQRLGQEPQRLFVSGTETAFGDPHCPLHALHGVSVSLEALLNGTSKLQQRGEGTRLKDVSLVESGEGIE
jgi:hypothetical protein